MSESTKDDFAQILARLTSASDEIIAILEKRQDQELIALFTVMVKSFSQLQSIISTSKQAKEVIAKAKGRKV